MKSSVDQIDFLFKIVMLGESGVGKTNIIRRFVQYEFIQDLNPTIGVDSSLKTLKVDSKNVKLQIWDTADQE